MKCASYDIVFQEVPDEVTLALNISNCPHRCEGCHSPYLRENRGEILDEAMIKMLLEQYGGSISCVCFMGGDAEPEVVEVLSNFIKKTTFGKLKTAWYSGRVVLPDECSVSSFDFIKLGPYMASKGGLDSPNTNQRFYQIKNGQLIDSTFLFQKNGIVTKK